MARDVSILISAKDNFSTAIKTMRNANTAFRKDMEDTQRKLDALNNTKAVLKVDTKKAQDALKEAEKQFAKTGDAADELKLQMANADYENARRNLGMVSKEARQAEKDMQNLGSTMSKTENRASSGTSGIMKSLVASGATKMIGDTLTMAASTAIGSAFGAKGEMYFSNILGSATSGAAIGTMIAPGIGTAIGAVGGAALGAVNGVLQEYKNEDEAFKGAVQDTYDTIKQDRAATLESGTGIAANRETALMSFTTLFGDDQDAASGFLDEIKNFANVTPFLFDDLTGMSKVLKTYGYEIDELMPMMQKIGDTGAALGMDQNAMNMVATALGRMKSSNKTNAEYLNLLLERGIPAYDYLAKASGISKDQAMEMVSKGLIPGAEAAEAIANFMGKDFEGSMERQSQTFAGLSSTLQGMQDEMSNAMGEGYNDERKKGLQAQIDWFSGESGEKMKEANRMIGEWQASLENEREAAIRKAMDDMVETDAYKEAAAAGDRVKMGELMAQAQVEGENAYKLSDGYKLQVEADKSMVQMIRSEMVQDKVYWDYGYEMGLEFSKGQLAAVQENSDVFAQRALEGIRQGNVFSNRDSKPSTNFPSAYVGREAWGLRRVPYDNFPAMLHFNERVLTASEARQQDQPPAVNISGTFYIREEADIDRVAGALVDKVRQAQRVT